MGLTRTRLQLAIYFCLHRGSLPENTASWQEPKRQTLSLLCGEQNRQNTARAKYWKTALSIFAALSASIALADDFKTNNGKEYKNATVTQVEADGIVVRTKVGISKLYFTELPKDVQERFHYDPANAAAAQAAQVGAFGPTLPP